MRVWKMLAVAAIAVIAAGCQTAPRGYADVTQQVYGNAHPAVPSDWKRVARYGGQISYVCPIAQCADPGAIAYSAKLHTVDGEFLIRRRIITANLLMEVNKSFSNATSGRYRVGAVRNLTNRSAAGFETTGSVETNRGTFYGVTRIAVNGRESRSVTGVGTTPAKARRNLLIGIDGAR